MGTRHCVGLDRLRLHFAPVRARRQTRVENLWLGFRVKDSGLRIQGSGFRVHGVGLRVEVEQTDRLAWGSLGFRMYGLGSRASGVGCTVASPDAVVTVSGACVRSSSAHTSDSTVSISGLEVRGSGMIGM